jgi:hypothetical protein
MSLRENRDQSAKIEPRPDRWPRHVKGVLTSKRWRLPDLPRGLRVPGGKGCSATGFIGHQSRRGPGMEQRKVNGNAGYPRAGFRTVCRYADSGARILTDSVGLPDGATAPVMCCKIPTGSAGQHAEKC